MGTVIRSEVSKKNEFYIPKHRYYELKHFCMQYPEWKKTYEDMCLYIPGGIIKIDHNKSTYDNKYYMREKYYNNIELLQRIADLTDPVLGIYILRAVTEGRSYEYFRMNCSIPCGKDIFCRLYRKFFWILSKQKD